MKERPILFNGPMVRAILNGSKTQTRRFLKSQGSATRAMLGTVNCHLGQPGDHLWVRETSGLRVLRDGAGGTGEFRVYRASNPDAIYATSACGAQIPIKWTPSIHMPRAASRIDLLIKSVRIERLQDISEADALAEGITYDQLPDNPHDLQRARTWYRGLWEEINGAGSWEANPWVWVIEFERIRP